MHSTEYNNAINTNSKKRVTNKRLALVTIYILFFTVGVIKTEKCAVSILAG